MSITAVGSIAYETVRTPSGTRERMLGGAATHFALAASFFDTVTIVGCVGGDFGEEQFAILRTRDTRVADVVRVPDARTACCSGDYGWDLNTPESADSQPHVFEHFRPRLSAGARACDVLFLANIHPALQVNVLTQCDQPAFTALDSMDLWIEVARRELIGAISCVDCVILSDAGLRLLTGASSLVAAARAVLGTGPSLVVAKRGEYGAVLVTRGSVFAIPAYPCERVVDTTGAGDAFAGAFVGYIARHLNRPLTDGVLRRAMAYGTAIASHKVEGFGTDRVVGLTLGAVEARVRELHAIATFACEPASVA